MSAPCPTPAATVAPPTPRTATRARDRAARLVTTEGWRLGLLVSLVVVYLAGSSAPTPLYATYQGAWRFSLMTTTVVFGIYALAVLAGLLVLGRVSDSVGRRPVVLVATATQIAAMALFATATGVIELSLARVLQGVATGAALGALGAAMIEASPRRGATANAAAPGFGTGLGAIGSALVVTLLPAPTHTVYLVLATVMALQLVAVTATMAPGRPVGRVPLRLVPTLRVPTATRAAVVAAAPVLFAVWALAGFYGSLGPALLASLTGRTTVVLGGLGLFLLAGVAAASTIALRRATPATVLRLGLAALAVGVGGALGAVALHSAAGFLLATVVGGVGFGSGFQGALRTVLATTGAGDRAGVLSTLYVVSYLGMGLPAVAAGWLVVHGHPLSTVTYWYGGFLLLLAAAAAALRIVRNPARRPILTRSAQLRRNR